MKAPAALRLLIFVCLAVLLSACNQYDPYNPDTNNLIGVWGTDNNEIRQAEEKPVMKQVHVYATHMEYSAGNGTVGTQGQWREDGFWCQKADGSGEVEVAKLVSPEEIELHISAFDPLNQEVDVLYKERGSDAEMESVAARYPQPITYPPPAGVVKFGMTEYQLKSLPWKADQIAPTYDDSYSRGTIYTYHSDNPSLEELKVTVKNRRVVLIKGGNE
jgi:hypothetical protein